MNRSTRKRFLFTAWCVFFSMIFFQTPLHCFADSCDLPGDPYPAEMTISPSLIVLNYNGSSEYVITDFHAQLGYLSNSMGDFCVGLYFNGVQIAQAVDIRKTLAGHTAVYFIRQEVQDNPVVQALAGMGIVDVQIIGWFDAMNSSGEPVTNIFIAIDPDGAEIIDPGNGQSDQ